MDSVSIDIEQRGDRWGWSCSCGMNGGDWDYWETVELVVNSHRLKKHGGSAHIHGYDLRPERKRS